MADNWSISHAWEKPAIALTQSTDNLLRVTLEPPASAVSRGLRVAMAIDTSRSMGQAMRLPEARAACEALAGRLAEHDRLHLASWSSRLQEQIRGLSGGERLRDELRARLSALAPRGLTRTDLALDWLAETLGREDDMTSIAILVTDGVPTDGQGYPLSDSSLLEDAVRRMREAGCRLYCVGIGDADYFNPALLDRLAQLGGGRFIYHPDGTELATALDTLVEDCRGISAKYSALRISLRLQGARLRDVSRVSQDFQQCEMLTEGQVTIVSLGVLTEKQSTELLLDLQFAPAPLGSQEAERNAVFVELLQEGSCLASCKARLQLTNSFTESRTVNPAVQVAASRNKLNLLMRDLQQSSEPRRTSQLLEQIADRADELKRPEIASDARQQLSDLRKTGKLTRHRATSLLSRTTRDERT